MWYINACIVEETFGGFVNREEEFYICPECGEPVYKCDWTEHELAEAICPICGFDIEDEMEEEEE